jgi:hypothetical protein
MGKCCNPLLRPPPLRSLYRVLRSKGGSATRPVLVCRVSFRGWVAVDEHPTELLALAMSRV